MSLATARKFQKLCSNNNVVLMTAIRNHWNKDYKPGNFPVNEEQRLAAAKKYNLHPDDYKPHPDDGCGLGDYPDIPAVSGDSKDPHYPWDNPELKRNFNEVMHPDFDLFGEDRYDISFKHRIPVVTQVLQFAFVIFGTFGLYYWMEGMRQFPGLLPKQYPHQGVTHYGFAKKD